MSEDKFPTVVLEVLDVPGAKPLICRTAFSATQIAKSGRGDLVLTVSERLNLAGAGVDVSKTPAKMLWFKGKIEPSDVLALIEG